MRLAIVFPLTVAIASGAAVFKGKVVRNEVGGAPVAGANIQAPGANPTVSRSPHGDFVLEFPSKNPGDRFTLSVAMPGMVVVNFVQLVVILPADPDANELNVILARETEREEMARRFFRLASTKAIEESYKRKIEEGKKDREQLKRERDEAKAAAGRAAEELAKLRPGESSALYEEAMRLFAGGKTDEALQALSEAKLRRLSQEAQERKEQAEKQLAEATRGWLLRGRLLTTKLQFADAEKAYGEAVKASPGDFAACFQQAYFLGVLKRYNPAVQSYVRCLALARSKADPASVAMTLNNLGILHNAQNRMEEARKAFEEALDLYRRSDTYLPYVATTLNNLGGLHRAQNRMEEARKAYEEALGIRRQLARANPDTYLPDVAMTLNNLGVLHRDQNRMEEARKAFEEALDTYRRLARANAATFLPDTYLPYVATTLNNLGILHSVQNRMEEARKAFEEALDTYRRLARANPDTYLPDVAMTLNNLGNLHRAQNRKEEARKAYEEALDTYRRLARANPATYLPGVAMTLNNLGNLQNDQSRMEEARKAYEEALDTYRRLARANPDTYPPDVAMTLNNLGVLHRAQNRMEEARKAYEEALDTYRRLARANPDTYLPDVAMTLNNLGNLHRDQNRMEEAWKAYEEALDTYRRLARANPDTYLPDLARVLLSIGRMHIGLHQASEARQALKEALGIFQNFAAKDRAQYQRFVDVVNADLSKVSQ